MLHSLNNSECTGNDESDSPEEHDHFTETNNEELVNDLVGDYCEIELTVNRHLNPSTQIFEFLVCFK